MSSRLLLDQSVPVDDPFKRASVVELVYTADLKSAGVSLAGSSPATRTIFSRGAFEAPLCCLATVRHSTCG